MADEPSNPDPASEDTLPEDIRDSQPDSAEALPTTGQEPEANAADAEPNPADTSVDETTSEPVADAVDNQEVADLIAAAENDDTPSSDESAEPEEATINVIDQAEMDALTGQGNSVSDSESLSDAGNVGDDELAEVDAMAAEMAAAIAAEANAVDMSAETPAMTSGPAEVEPARGPAVIGNTDVTVSPEDASEFMAPELNTPDSDTHLGSLNILDDVELDVKVELGRAGMYIEDVLRLAAGSVVELDKLAGDPVDIYVNERLIARGEVLVLNDNFCVRINDIHSPIPELDQAD